MTADDTARTWVSATGQPTGAERHSPPALAVGGSSPWDVASSAVESRVPPVPGGAAGLAAGTDVSVPSRRAEPSSSAITAGLPARWVSRGNASRAEGPVGGGPSMASPLRRLLGRCAEVLAGGPGQVARAEGPLRRLVTPGNPLDLVAWPAPALAGAGAPAWSRLTPPVRGVALRAERQARGAAAPRRAAAPRPAPPRSRTRPPVQGSRRPPRPKGPPRTSPVHRLRRAWDRPLTAYYVVLGTGLLLTFLGLVMVFSASQIQALRWDLPATFYFRKQMLAAAIGAVLLLIASRTSIRLLRALTYPFLAGSVVLLVLVQVPGIGVSVNGNTNWIALGGSFQLQPSEFAKLALVLWGADLLARKGELRLLTQWRHLLIPLLPGALLVCGLVMVGGDMGTVVILVAVVFALLWLSGAPVRLFGGALAVAAVLGTVFIANSPHRMDRITCLGAGDAERCQQAVHGIYALASGGWFGSGLGASMEKWGELPEPHTDFIFAITGEELGLAGTLSVLGLFAALGYAGIRVAGRTEDAFVRYAAGGVTAWLMVQTVINIGAVLGLLPIAGVPLPLFSYGGSALLPTMFAVGLLIAFARSEPSARAALAARDPGHRWKTMRRRRVAAPSGER